MPAREFKAVIYTAKSTEDQHGSLATQLADCRGMAEREGWEVIGEYQDEGFSAYSGNRGPGLEQARGAAVDAAPCVLVAQHSDRVARGAGDAPDAAEHLVEVVAHLRRQQVTLRTCQDDFFADPRMGNVMAAMMGMRNTEDSARKSEAVKSGKRRAFERGDLPGGAPPDGLERMGNQGRLDPDRIDIIRLIGELAEQGWGDPSIAREMNRRGHRTKGGGAWTRRRIQDLLTNVRYYGGIFWRRGAEDEEVNWAGHVAPWTREDFERRMRARSGRDLAKGSARRGRPHVNHALAGLAVCGRCSEVMRPVTSTYRRKDGSRRRNYVCRHVYDCTGLCDMPPIDAEVIDTHVVNELQRYLGDFEALRDQFVSGYANERERLTRQIESARTDVAEQERIAKRTERNLGYAEDERQARAAMRAAGSAQEELERRQTRLDAAQRALEDVPDEAPADAMLDFYNELGEAVRGRLDGANTVARVNDALRDLFAMFILGPAPDLEGTLVVPVLQADRGLMEKPFWDADDARRLNVNRVNRLERITPPLRKLEVPSPQLANSQEYRWTKPNRPAFAASQP